MPDKKRGEKIRSKKKDKWDCQGGGRKVFGQSKKLKNLHWGRGLSLEWSLKKKKFDNRRRSQLLTGKEIIGEKGCETSHRENLALKGEIVPRGGKRFSFLMTGFPFGYQG